MEYRQTLGVQVASGILNLYDIYWDPVGVSKVRRCSEEDKERSLEEREGS